MCKPTVIDPAVAVRAVSAYNRGRYRSRLNVDIDRDGYDRFRSGLASGMSALVEQLRFVGEEYGGAQARFISHGYREEAALMATKLAPARDELSVLINELPPLNASVPSPEVLTRLFAPFAATKRWGVWASKTLHFLRPATFPILDSRAKTALSLRSLDSSAPDYHRFCLCFQEAIRNNALALTAARAVDNGTSPSDLKLFDKVLYETGTEVIGGAAA
jgi:hypothetical protein